MALGPGNLVGSYIPQSNVWDVSQLYSVNVNSQEFKELLVRLYQNINNISIAVNTKVTGYYPLQEFVCSKLFFPNPSAPATQYPVYRQVMRLTINFGALLNTGAKSVPHGINVTNTTTFVGHHAWASDTTAKTFIPIPYASPTLANNIELRVDSTYVTIETGSNRTNYNVCYVTLEYIQQ